MAKTYLFSIVFLVVLVLNSSCSRKHHMAKTLPESSENDKPVIVEKKNDSIAVKKPVFKPKKKDIIPNVITVNDAAAHTSIDGRLYYDLIGHRYWKNYKDGKYYLFNQSMYNNPAFKAPANK